MAIKPAPRLHKVATVGIRLLDAFRISPC
jgi:hypothetical protein